MKCYVFGIILIFVASACQKKPSISSAADPLSSLSPPPMGATVYNDEMKKELWALEELLANRIEKERLAKVKKALLDGRKGENLKDLMNDELAKLFMRMPELVHNSGSFSANDKLWYKGKLLFLLRRFPESAMLMTELLKADPSLHQARNWRARSIFFLGNLDLALSELEFIQKNTPKNSYPNIEALYLIGAIIYESSDNEKRRINTGINAWQEYLNLVMKEDAIHIEVTKGLAELKLRLNQGDPASFDPFLPNKKYSSEKNAILQAFSKGDNELAMSLAEKAQKSAYDRDIALIKARLLLKSGLIEQALKNFQEIATKNPKYAPAFHYRGMAFMFSGKPEEAVSSWQKTLSLDAGYANHYNLQHRIEEAKKMLGGPTKIGMH